MYHTLDVGSAHTLALLHLHLIVLLYPDGYCAAGAATSSRHGLPPEAPATHWWGASRPCATHGSDAPKPRLAMQCDGLATPCEAAPGNFLAACCGVSAPVLMLERRHCPHMPHSLLALCRAAQPRQRPPPARWPDMLGTPAGAGPQRAGRPQQAVAKEAEPRPCRPLSRLPPTALCCSGLLLRAARAAAPRRRRRGCAACAPAAAAPRRRPAGRRAGSASRRPPPRPRP